MIGGRDLRAALPGWVAGRVLVGAAWLASSALVALRDIPRPVPMDQGLFAWDGVYYRAIAEIGYEAAGPAASRFHPLLPLLGMTVVGLVIVTQVVGLLCAAVGHRLVREVTGDGDLARRVATLLGIAPPAFSLVWVYGEGLLLLFAALHLLALHRRQWLLVAAWGALAVLARPTGLLLVVPAVVAAGLDLWRRPTDRPDSGLLAASGTTASDVTARAEVQPVDVSRGTDGRPRRSVVATVAGASVAAALPLVTMTAWVAWVGDRFGDRTLPLDIQSSLRDGTHFPPFRLVEGIGEVFTDPLGDGLHVPFAFLVVWLAWVAWRQQPRPWAGYAIAGAAVFLAAGNLNSLERYAFATLPLTVALAQVSGGRRWRPVVVVCGMGLLGMATLGWQGEFVP